MDETSKKNDSAGILADMADAHEDQPGEKVQAPVNGKPPEHVNKTTDPAPREDD